MPNDRFPIQDGPSVPWSYMAPHESMARLNHRQTLERLSERGGLSCAEAELLVTGQPLFRKGGENDWDSLKQRWIKRAERVNAEHTREMVFHQILEKLTEISEATEETKVNTRRIRSI